MSTPESPADARQLLRDHLLTDHAPAILWVTDADGSCSYLNKRWFEATGQTPEQALGFGWLDATHDDDKGPTGDAFTRANSRCERFEIDYRLRHADGSYRWMADVGNPRFDPDGRYLGMVGTVVDIDERVSAQAELRLSEARFRAAVEAVAGVMWTNTAEGEMRGEQAGWSALTGQGFAAYQGYGWADAVHVEDAGPTIEAWNHAVAERSPFVFEHRVRRFDGVWRHFSVHAIPIVSAGEIVEWVGLHTDITAAREAEQALRESEEHYRNAAELNPQVAWTATPDGQLDRVAERWHEWTGTSGLGDSWGQGLHPDDLDRSGAAWLHSITTGDPYDVEHRVKRVDGSFRWARSRAYPRRADDGRILKWYGSTEDIDDRKTAEARANASAIEFRGVAEALPGFAWTADDQGGLVYTSPTWHDYSGSRPDDSAGAGWAAFVHPDDQPRAFAQWAHSLSTGEPYEVELRLRDRHGNYHWWLARARQHRDGQARWIGTATELDEIVAARELLAASSREFQRQVEERTAEIERMWQTSPDLLAEIDFEGVFVRINPAWTTVLGYRPEDLLGETLMQFVYLQDVQLTHDALAQAANATLPVVENRYLHKDGGTRWISWVAAPAGNRIYATGRDITASKAQAEALAEAEDQLRQSQKLEAVGQLTGGVAHDFNNLLTVIRGSVDLLKRPGLSDERKERYIEAISDTVTRAAKLTGQLLAFARRQALKPDVFDAGAAVGAIAEMIGTLTGSRIRTDIIPPNAPVFINADPSQFDTAVVNLVVNARDAMNGEGVLTITVGPSESDGQDDFVAIAITDTGTGIAPDVVGQIFEPFYTTKGVGQGTGLGLSQVYGFAKQSGGEIDVESDYGHGATFTLYLPRVAPPVKAGQSEGADAQLTDGAGTCVLLVEDNEAVGNFAQQTLAELGYDTVFAEDAAAALVELERDADRFHIVFSDVMMPGMNGIELGGEIQRRYPGLPVVLTSGYSHVLAQHGSSGFELVHKPYSMEELSRVLAAAARGRSQ